MATKTTRCEFVRVRVSSRELAALAAVADAETERQGAKVFVSDIVREGLEAAVRRGLRLLGAEASAKSS